MDEFIRYKAWGLPKLFWKASLEKDFPRFANKIKKMVESGKNRKGLLIHGEEGVGKSRLLAAIAIFVHKETHKPFRFVSQEELSDAERNSWEGDIEKLQTLLEVPYLYLDNINLSGDFILRLIEKVLRNRVFKVLPTFISTRCEPEEFPEVAKEACEWVLLRGSSKREERKKVFHQGKRGG